MIALPPGVRVCLACGTTDMRKGMAGLAMLVQQDLAEALLYVSGEIIWRRHITLRRGALGPAEK
jgi:IS66 Orf2 like protein